MFDPSYPEFTLSVSKGAPSPIFAEVELGLASKTVSENRGGPGRGLEGAR
jgi:hypothetical protein